VEFVGLSVWACEEAAGAGVIVLGPLAGNSCAEPSHQLAG
jgi:hypothetical protein